MKAPGLVPLFQLLLPPHTPSLPLVRFLLLNYYAMYLLYPKAFNEGEGSVPREVGEEGKS